MNEKDHMYTSLTTVQKGLHSIVTAVIYLALIVSTMVDNSTVNASSPITFGYRDFTWNTSLGQTTGEKPQSKLWWNDGYWWGVLWSNTQNTFTIQRMDLATHNWVDTGVRADDRKLTRADALWDGQYLYIASNYFTTSAGPASSPYRGRVYRYSYNASTDTYTADSGFPVEVTGGRSESLVIEKDSGGTLWVTYVESSKVMLNHSLNGDDRSWGTPFQLPVAEANVSSDDLSSLIAYKNHIGVMWSNQSGADSIYFATHPVGSPDNVWTRVRSYGLSGDDHVNLKQLDSDAAGNVFAIVKTERSADLIVLLVCKNNANHCKTESDWENHTVYSGATYSPTRPILEIDTSSRELYVFTQNKDANDWKGIYYKKSSIDNIQFDPDSIGIPFIVSAEDDHINDPSSTKQNVNSTTGLLVIASDAGSRAYFHNYLNLGGGPPTPTAPTPTTATPSPEPTTPTPEPTTPTPEPTTPTPEPTTPTPEPTTPTPDPTTPVPTDTPSPETIKNITFEDGSLVHESSGVDSVNGSVVLDSGGPINGTYSASITGVGNAYLQEVFTDTDDLFVSFYLKLNSAPPSSTRFFLISNSGDSVGNLYIMTNGTLRLREDSTTIGYSAPLEVGTVYRVGFRQKRGTGSDGVLEAYLAVGNEPFGAPFAVSNNGLFTTPANRLRIGATTSGTVNLVLDDIRLNSGSMPAP